MGLLLSKFFIVNPGISIGTAWAFSQLDERSRSNKENNLKEVIQQPVETWKNKMVNDFENIVFQKHQEIKTIKEKLYEAGALYSAMSGSGSTVFGIFKKENMLQLTFPDNYFIKEIEMH